MARRLMAVTVIVVFMMVRKLMTVVFTKRVEAARPCLVRTRALAPGADGVVRLCHALGERGQLEPLRLGLVRRILDHVPAHLREPADDERGREGQRQGDQTNTAQIVTVPRKQQQAFEKGSQSTR